MGRPIGAERRRLDGDEERINRMIEKALAALWGPR
jgi:hypothetical protein